MLNLRKIPVPSTISSGKVLTRENLTHRSNAFVIEKNLQLILAPKLLLQIFSKQLDFFENRFKQYF